ncbi:hypothetical protein G4O51_00135 [Candidatus Bathyarchaeota archaeon A05DMB-2]|nr:hypothetical protein [Candidatus Bathyarchaeota archaeon A05DMB-2]
MTHFRSDFPERNDEKWLKHTLVFKSAAGMKAEHKSVTITRFEPKARKY